jgi:hypothetical protein
MIITSDTNLYSFYIETNLLQETKGGFYPWDVLPALTEHKIQPGVQNYSVALTLGIYGNFDILPDGNYTFYFEIQGDFKSIPLLHVIQDGLSIHIEHIITFNTLMPVTSTTNIVTSNSEQIIASSESTLIDPLPISSSYLLFLLLPIFSIIKSRFKVKTRR